MDTETEIDVTGLDTTGDKSLQLIDDGEEEEGREEDVTLRPADESTGSLEATSTKEMAARVARDLEQIESDCSQDGSSWRWKKIEERRRRLGERKKDGGGGAGGKETEPPASPAPESEITTDVIPSKTTSAAPADRAASESNELTPLRERERDEKEGDQETQGFFLYVPENRNNKNETAVDSREQDTTEIHGGGGAISKSLAGLFQVARKMEEKEAKLKSTPSTTAASRHRFKLEYLHGGEKDDSRSSSSAAADTTLTMMSATSGRPAHRYCLHTGTQCLITSLFKTLNDAQVSRYRLD